MITSLSTTIAVLKPALSRTPRTSTQVMPITDRNAGRLKRIGTPPMCGAVSTAWALRTMLGARSAAAPPAAWYSARAR